MGDGTAGIPARINLAQDLCFKYIFVSKDRKRLIKSGIPLCLLSRATRTLTRHGRQSPSHPQTSVNSRAPNLLDS